MHASNKPRYRERNTTSQPKNCHYFGIAASAQGRPARAAKLYPALHDSPGTGPFGHDTTRAPMENRRNYYRILHIQPDAPTAIIKASYRTQMQKLRMHPDLGGDEWNAQLLNEAYRTLSDPDLRRAYDREFFAARGKLRESARRDTATATTTGTVDSAQTAFKPDPSRCPFCNSARPARQIYPGPADCPNCGAPLETANNLRLIQNARRAVARSSRNEAIAICLTPGTKRYPGTLRDLSPNGMQLLSPTPLQINQVIQITCAALTATGRITYCNRVSGSGQFVAGLEFLTLRFYERSGTFLSVSA